MTTPTTPTPPAPAPTSPAPPASGWVTISPNELYAEVRAVREAVSDVRTAVGAINNVVTGFPALETRLRALETRLAGWLNPVGALGGLVGVVSAVWQAVKH